MLEIPDFSAGERTFQLLTQAAGRAGRDQKEARVIIQTYAPDNPVIKCAKQHDFDSFYQFELKNRALYAYPPFSYLLKLTCRGKNNKKVSTKAKQLTSQLKSHPELLVLGPVDSFRKIGNFYSYQIIVKSPRRSNLVAIASKLPSFWTHDLDPISLI